MTADQQPRYAVYLTPPPDSELAQCGAAWLGRDCWSDAPVKQPEVPDIEHITQAPRHYGFHGTLRAPFELREWASVTDLCEVVRRFARNQAPLDLCLSPEMLGPFLALQASDQQAVQLLQQQLLPVVEPFRATLTEADRARRMRSPLSERQVELLDLWGYPYVLDEFRFHMTLTGPLNSTQADTIRKLAEAFFKSALAAPLSLMGLALFHQSDRSTAFRAVEFFPLGN